MKLESLPIGVTGFFYEGEPRALVDPMQFRSACFLVARGAAGLVESFDSDLLARNYYAATLVAPEPVTVLCNSVYPYLAFLPAGEYGFRQLRFQHGAHLASLFSDLTEFRAVDLDSLNRPIQSIATDRLAAAEMDQLRYWQRSGLARRVGDAIFNAWD